MTQENVFENIFMKYMLPILDIKEFFNGCIYHLILACKIIVHNLNQFLVLDCRNTQLYNMIYFKFIKLVIGVNIC